VQRLDKRRDEAWLPQQQRCAGLAGARAHMLRSTSGSGSASSKNCSDRSGGAQHNPGEMGMEGDAVAGVEHQRRALQRRRRRRRRGARRQQRVQPGHQCDCSFNSNTVCHITMLKVYALNVVGQIPSELQNLTYLTYLNLDQNYLMGPIPSFIGQFSGMQHLSLGFNPFSGPLPKELGNLTNLNLL